MQSYRRRIPVTSAALTARRARRARITALLVLLFFLALIGGSVYLIRAPFLRIQTIAVTGADSQSNAQIADFIRGQLSGDYYFIIPRNHVFDYGRLNLGQRILAAFPLLSDASITLTSPSSLAVSVSERLPQALWCGESISNPEPCELMDGGGAAYAPAPFASSTAYVAYYGALRAPAVPQAEVRQFLTPHQFRALAAATESIAEKAGAGPAQAAAINSEGDVAVQFQNGFTLKFTLPDATDRSADLLQRFSLALQSAPFQQHALKEFEYLDLRFGDSLYYKLKAGETAASTTLGH